MTSAGRSREATRERLLVAARARFREQGFDATTVREIAADAAVDPAMIMRYFGSKEGLFTEITLTDSSPDSLLGGERSTLGHRLAVKIVEKKSSDGIEIVLRSLGNAGVSARYERELEERFVEPLALFLGGRDARVRAALIVSILNGLTLSKVVLEQRSINNARPTQIKRHLGATLQSLIDGDSHRNTEGTK